MSIAITHTIQVLQVIVQTVPLGTNLALLQLMWTILNGSFLQSRGAIFPALKANRFTPTESRRIWSAFRHGVWCINECIARWRSYVLAEREWQSHEYEGYRPVAVDWTAFWRFKLKGWTGKLFHSAAGRALRGVGFGVVCQVGQVDGQRIPLLRQIIRTSKKDRSEATLKADTLRWVRYHLDENEAAIADAGVEISDIQAAALGRAACEADYKVQYHRTSRLLQSLELAHADGSFPQLLAKLSRIHLLIFDDWLRDPLSRSQTRDLLEILDDRYGRAATMVVTQVPVAECHGRIPDPTLADAILDRLIHNAYRLELQGESMRKVHSPLTSDPN